MARKTTIGGQALLEGVMMLGPKKSVCAFCDTDGNISTEEVKINFMRDKYPLLGKPFLRGIFNFIDTMRLAMKSMEASTDKMTQGQEEASGGFDKWIEDKLGEKASAVIMGIGTVLGLVLSVVLFMYLPVQAFNGISYLFDTDIEYLRAIVEGLLRGIIFVAYVLLISLIPDIKRVYMYHGAEHKTIFCYEAQLDLTVENIKKQSRFHPRCGTSFLVILILLGIIVGLFIPFTNPILRTMAKLLTLPLVVSVGYELIKLCGKFDNVITRIVSAPGMWVQRITTKEPDDNMILTAVAALEAVIPENGEDIVV